MENAAAPEFSRRVDIGAAEGRDIVLTATAGERAALAARFGLIGINALTARVSLTRAGLAVLAEGRLEAWIVQACAVSAEEMVVMVDEPLRLRFVPESAVARGADGGGGEVIEVSPEDCDDIPFAGTGIDLGEAVAQSLALAIDPFATGPEAERVRAAGLVAGDAGPFAALAALKKPMDR